MSKPTASIHLIIPCAGNGSRMQSEQPKQYALVAQRPLLEHCIIELQKISAIKRILLVLSPDSDYIPSPDLSDRVELHFIGGTTRAQSVQNALTELSKQAAADDWVLVHDAARCLITAELVTNLIDRCLAQQQGGLLAIPIADSIKQVQQQQVQRSIARTDKWLAQTPQMFPIAQLQQALQQAKLDDNSITDEASAIESLGAKPLIVDGSSSNFKVTYPQDLALAKLIIAQRNKSTVTTGTNSMQIRVGEGWDIHALVTGRPLIIGGVTIPHHLGLLGHSDADVLLHAITDALLGASGKADIGSHFSDKNPKYKGQNSSFFLQCCYQWLVEDNWKISNIDCTIIAQQPKLAPYKAAMQQNIASLLKLNLEQVNIKAKTAEKLGPVGQELAIEARAVVLLTRD